MKLCGKQYHVLVFDEDMGWKFWWYLGVTIKKWKFIIKIIYLILFYTWMPQWVSLVIFMVLWTFDENGIFYIFLLLFKFKLYFPCFYYCVLWLPYCLRNNFRESWQACWFKLHFDLFMNFAFDMKHLALK